MILNDKESVFAECEKLGEACIRAAVDANSYGINSALPRQWLLEKAEERRSQMETEARQQTNER